MTNYSVLRPAPTTRTATSLSTSKIDCNSLIVMIIYKNGSRNYQCRLGTDRTCLSISNRADVSVYMDAGSRNFLEIPPWLSEQLVNYTCPGKNSDAFNSLFY